MAVLLTTKKGFINAVIEPQFQIGSGAIVTVQFSEYDDVRDLQRYLKGDVLFDQRASLFPFTSYIHMEDLEAHFKHKKLWKQLHDNKVDFSKPPIAFYWEAWYRNEDLDDESQADEGLYFGNSLPEEIDDVRWGFDRTPDVFHVYPLYEMPRELIREEESALDLGIEA